MASDLGAFADLVPQTGGGDLGAFADLVPQQDKPQAPEQPDMGQLAVIARGLTRGVTGNWNNEMEAAQGAALAGTPLEKFGPAVPFSTAIGAGRYLVERFTGQEGPATKAYNEHMVRSQAQDELARQQYPGTMLASELAGAVGTPIPGSLMARGANWAARMGAGALTGGAISAAAGAGEGQGAERATNAVRAAPFGVVGGAVLGPMTGRAAQAGASGQDVIDAAQRLGITALPRGVTSDSRATQALTQAARQIPVTGAKIDDRILSAVEGMGQKADELAAGAAGFPPDRASTGAVLRSSLNDLVTANKQKMDDAYGAVRGMINPDVKVRLPNTLSVLDDIGRSRAAAGHMDPGFQNIRLLAERGGSFNGVQRVRSELSDAINFNNPHPGFTVGDMKRLRGALSEDLNGIIGATAKPEMAQQALGAFKKANADAAGFIEQNRRLRQITGLKADESVAGKIINAMQGKTGDIKLLAQLRNAMPKEDFSVVAGQVVSELGKNASTGAFSANQFFTQWNKLGGRAKDIVFADPALRRSLNDIATVSERLKKVGEYANRSNTGRVALLGGAVGLSSVSGIDVNPLNHLEKIIPAMGLAYMLSRPAGASAVARWTRAFSSAAKSRSPGAVASLTVATRDLQRNMPQGLGVGRADDEQPEVPGPRAN